MADLKVGIDARGAKTGADKFVAATKRVGAGAKTAGRQMVRAGKELDRFSDKTGRVAKKSLTAAKAVLAFAAAYGAFRLVKKVIGDMAEYERALVAVGKTANLTGQALRDLGHDFQLVAATTPLALAELLKVGAVAGQLGVTGRKNIVDFTVTVAKLAQVSNVVGEEGAAAIARLLTVTGESVGTVSRFGAVITALGNNSAATESEILKMGLEIAKATAVFKVSSQEALAFGAALASVGVAPELAATAIGKSFRTIDDAVRNGGRNMEVLARITGKTGDEIRETFGASTAAGFTLFLGGLQRIIREGGDVNAVLAELGLSNERILKTLPVLASNYDLVIDKMQMAAREAKGQQALNKEFEASSDTLHGSLNRLSNVWDVWIAGLSKANGPLQNIIDKTADLLINVLGLSDVLAKQKFELQFQTGTGQQFANQEQERLRAAGQERFDTGTFSKARMIVQNGRIVPAAAFRSSIGPEQRLPPPRGDAAAQGKALQQQLVILQSLRDNTVQQGGASEKLLERIHQTLTGESFGLGRFAMSGEAGKLPSDLAGAGRRLIRTGEPDTTGVTSNLQQGTAQIAGQNVAIAFIDRMIEEMQRRIASNQTLQVIQGQPGAEATGAAPSGRAVDLKAQEKGLAALQASKAEREEIIRLMQIELKHGRAAADQEAAIAQARAQARADAQAAFGVAEGNFDARVFAAEEAAQKEIERQQKILGLINQKADAVRDLAEAERQRERAADRQFQMELQQREQLINRTNQYAQVVVSGFIQGSRAGADFNLTLQRIAETIGELILQELILQGIRGAFSTGGGKTSLGTTQRNFTIPGGLGSNSMKGNILREEHFARGGFPEIITTPISRVSAGTVQNFGENGRPGGEEVAIAPLKRTGSGELGVQIVGGGRRGGRSTVNHFTLNFFDKGRDVDDFKRNQRQIQQAIQDTARN